MYMNVCAQVAGSRPCHGIGPLARSLVSACQVLLAAAWVCLLLAAARAAVCPQLSRLPAQALALHRSRLAQNGPDWLR